MTAIRKVAGVIAGLGIVTGSLTCAATPAQAYPNDELTILSTNVNVDPYRGCDSVGDLIAEEKEDGCWLGDAHDGTLFRWDGNYKLNGYYAAKTEIYRNSEMLGKVEWHPRGEKLWIYDTANDGDTIYASVGYSNPDPDNHVMSAQPTSDPVDVNVVDFDFAEDQQIVIYVWDNKRPANNGGSYEIGYDELDAHLIRS